MARTPRARQERRERAARHSDPGARPAPCRRRTAALRAAPGQGRDGTRRADRSDSPQDDPRQTEPTGPRPPFGEAWTTRRRLSRVRWPSEPGRSARVSRCVSAAGSGVARAPRSRRAPTPRARAPRLTRPPRRPPGSGGRGTAGRTSSPERGGSCPGSRTPAGRTTRPAHEQGANGEDGEDCKERPAPEGAERLAQAGRTDPPLDRRKALAGIGHRATIADRQVDVARQRNKWPWTIS